MIHYHVIPHSHWDREWYLSFDEFRAMLVNMVDDLIEILDSDPAYESFLLDGQTIVLDDYLAVRPERRQKIMDLVAARRLFVGPWHVLPDSFLVSGEALIRNLLRGTQTAYAFGADRFIGYIPDSFGHTGQLPQIFRGFGLDCAIFWRGFGGEPGQEGSEYRWASPDGSWVLAEHLTEEGYSGAYFDTDDRDKIVETFNAMRARVDRRTDASARLMLSGGDHHWPVGRLTNVLDVLSDELGPEVAAIHSNPIAYFDELRSGVDLQSLPRIVGEQRFGYRWAFNVTGGVYSARMYLKQSNARSQRLLEGYLERLNAVVSSRGLKTQSPLIKHAWDDLIANHPHDSICGCSIDAVHREMMTRFEKVGNAGKAIERFLWQELTDDLEGVHTDDTQVVVFNPSSFSRSDPVECDVEILLQEVPVGGNQDLSPRERFASPKGISIRDSNGSPVRFEVVDRSEEFGISLNRHGYPAQSLVDRFRVRFDPGTVPATGFATFGILKLDAASPVVDPIVKTTEDGVENELIRVKVDSTGAFWVEVRGSGRKFGPLGILEDTADAGDEYNYSPPDHDDTYRSDQVRDVSIEWIPGPFRAGVSVSGVLSLPASLSDDLSRRSDHHVDVPFRTTAWLAAGAAMVEFETEIDNRARDHRLRVLFETGCNTNTHYADSAFGVFEREQREYEGDFPIEVPVGVAPAQRFVVVEEADRGATILADGLPEYELVYGSHGRIALTLLRCVGQLARGALRTRPGGRAGWYNPTPDAQCLGAHTFRYGFMPHQTPWYKNYDGIERAATRFLDPMRPKVTKSLGVSLPESGLITLDSNGIVVSALKEAEDGNGIVLRTYNATPESVSGRIVFGLEPRAVQRTRVDEGPTGEPADLTDGVLADTWRAYEIKTYRIEY